MLGQRSTANLLTTDNNNIHKKHHKNTTKTTATSDALYVVNILKIHVGIIVLRVIKLIWN